MSPRPAMITDFDIELFIKMLKMTTHENDNQALVAMRKANALLARHNLDWEGFAKGKITIVNDPFGNIPEPPKAQAAPKPAPQPPPPQRSQRDRQVVARRIALLASNRQHLRSWQASRLDSVIADWQAHMPNMHDADYGWLGNESAQFVPITRDAAQVSMFLDTCDLTPLSPDDERRVNQIALSWGATQLMNDRDYNWLESMHRHHHRPRGKKAKRLF